MVALELFNQMLGSVPDFQQGAVIAVVMLIPSIAIVGLMALLERYAIRYNKTAPSSCPAGACATACAWAPARWCSAVSWRCSR